MDKIEKIRQEIEKQLSAHDKVDHLEAFEVGKAWSRGHKAALKNLKSFIDSLPDENNPEPYNPVYDEDYLNEKIKKATESWKGVDVDAMLAECRGYEAPDESLEEAAKEYATTHLRNNEFPTADSAFIAGAGWQKNKDKETIEVAEDHAFMAGSVWQEEQMLKNAVEGVARPDDCEIWINLVGYGYKFNDGDKVKIIIVKEK